MMQFYKKRDFGALMSDTFLFFRIYGKNYFKNYFLINGVLIILLTGLLYIGYREFFAFLFGSNIDEQNSWIELYFSENSGLIFLFGMIFIMLFLSITAVSYSLPVFYLKRVSENPDLKVQPDDILGDLRKNLKRIVIMIAGLFFVVTPLFLILLMISYVLVLIVIGIFLLLLLIPITINVINFLIYDYLQNGRGFFETLSKAVRSQFSYSTLKEKSPFWKYWGTTSILYFMVYIISSAFSLIPLIIYWSALYTLPSSGASFEQNSATGSMGIIFFIIYMISLVVTFILMNILLIASGLMYYDNRTDLHRKMDLLEIDSIGNGAN